MWVTGELSYGQFGTLIKNEGYPKLADYLQKAKPGKKFISVGEKSYAVWGRVRRRHLRRDIAVRFEPLSQLPTRPRIVTAGTVARRASTCRHICWIRADASTSTPTAATPTARTWRFPSWIYPLDGDRFVPGTTQVTWAATRGSPTQPSR